MIERKCFICGGVNFDEITKRMDGSKIVKCKKCGNIILNPAYDEEEIKELYSRESYYSNKNNVGKESGYGTDFHEYNLKAMRNKKSHFYKRLKIIQKFKKFGSLLEIGCAHGYFLSFLKSSGYYVEGCELNPDACENAYDRSITIYNKPVEKIQFTKNYDVICAFDVIEHIADISNFIDSTKHLLTTSGIMFFSTPNFEEYYLFQLLKKKWIGLYSSLDHVNFFTPKIIKKFFNKKGLDVKFIRTTKYDIKEKPLKQKLFYISSVLLGEGSVIEIVLGSK